jgi:hypothetical protein
MVQKPTTTTIVTAARLRWFLSAAKRIDGRTAKTSTTVDKSGRSEQREGRVSARDIENPHIGVSQRLVAIDHNFS